MLTVSLFSPHHYPGCGPLSGINWFDDSRNLVDKRNSSSDMVENLYVFRLLPGLRHVFQKLENSVRHILEGAKMGPFVRCYFLGREVAMIVYNFTKMLRRHVDLFWVNQSSLLLYGLV